MTKVKDLISGDIVLVQDTQDRMAVLDSVGLPYDLLEEYPTIFARVGDAEILEVWGCSRFIPYLDEEVDKLYP